MKREGAIAEVDRDIYLSSRSGKYYVVINMDIIGKPCETLDEARRVRNDFKNPLSHVLE